MLFFGVRELMSLRAESQVSLNMGFNLLETIWANVRGEANRTSKKKSHIVLSARRFPLKNNRSGFWISEKAECKPNAKQSDAGPIRKTANLSPLPDIMANMAVKIQTEILYPNGITDLFEQKNIMKPYTAKNEKTGPPVRYIILTGEVLFNSPIVRKTSGQMLRSSRENIRVMLRVSESDDASPSGDNRKPDVTAVPRRKMPQSARSGRTGFFDKRKKTHPARSDTVTIMGRRAQPCQKTEKIPQTNESTHTQPRFSGLENIFDNIKSEASGKIML
ncbi:MAG: hypothetical protein WCV56_04460 [Candidatus Omnitrophota bacterium]